MLRLINVIQIQILKNQNVLKITLPKKLPTVPVCSFANSSATDNICRTIFSKNNCQAKNTYCNVGVDKTGQCHGFNMEKSINRWRKN
jgi:hypothetical protein